MYNSFTSEAKAKAIKSAEWEKIRNNIIRGFYELNFDWYFYARPTIWFEVPVATTPFYGRTEFLQQLHETLERSQSAKKITVLSQSRLNKVRGIGKTQTVVKYVSKFRNFYKHVVWVQAETEATRKNSLLKLADKLRILYLNSEFESLATEICDKLFVGLRKPNLLVFDNADDICLGEFLCTEIVPKHHQNLVILVISGNQGLWKKDPDNDKYHVLSLDVLSCEESLNFVLKQLQILDSPESREETREFVQLMGGYPLALQQSVAYIKEQRCKISDYVATFKSTNIRQISSPIFVSVKINLEKIKSLENGQSALEMMQFLSLLYPDKIPQSLIRMHLSLMEKQVFSVLALLGKYSLIHLELEDNEEIFVSIPRAVQFVVRQSLNNGDSVKYGFGSVLEKFLNNITHMAEYYGDILDYVLENCTVLLSTIDVAKSGDMLVNIFVVVNRLFKLYPMTKQLVYFIDKLAQVLYAAGKYPESHDLSDLVYRICRKYLGENNVQTLQVQHFIVGTLTAIGDYDEALSLGQDVVDRMEIHLGPDHGETVIEAKWEVARILCYLNKYPEASRVLKQVLGQMTKVLGDHDNDAIILKTKNRLAHVYQQQGNYEIAFKLREEVEHRMIETLGADDPKTLLMMNNKAWTLVLWGKFKEASPILHCAYEKLKTVAGEHHADTLEILDSIACMREMEGRLIEALELKKRVLEGRKNALGNDHAITQRTEWETENLMEKMNTPTIA